MDEIEREYIESMARAAKKHWRRVLDIVDAERSERARLVTENKALHAEARALRRKYGITITTERELVEWIDRGMAEYRAKIQSGQLQPRERYSIPPEALLDEITALAAKHGAGKWRSDVWQLVIFGKVFWSFIGFGVPTVAVKLKPGGGFEWDNKLDYPDNYDPTNPVLAAHAEYLRVFHADPVPQPQPTPGHPHDALDWRPVWEWEKRHPSITRTQIAKLLRRNRTGVARKLAELDAGLTRDK